MRNKLTVAILVAASAISGVAHAGDACFQNVIQDPSFELATGTTVIDSPNWTESSAFFDSPLCSNTLCGTGGGASPPRTGLIWAWFGGTGGPGEEAGLSQSFTIPTGTVGAELRYWMRNGTVATPFTDIMTVEVDGVPIQTFPEAATAEGAYTERTFDMTAFADGASHVLNFHYVQNAAGTASWVVDDVALNVPCPPLDFGDGFEDPVPMR